jgi:hypothetical protein
MIVRLTELRQREPAKELESPALSAAARDASEKATEASAPRAGQRALAHVVERRQK